MINIVKFRDSGTKRKVKNQKSEYEWYDKVCIHCGYRLGEHHSFDDKCPTEGWV